MRRLIISLQETPVRLYVDCASYAVSVVFITYYSIGRRRSLAICFGLIAVSCVVSAQVPEGAQTEVKNNVLPPSPTAAALGKYGDVPISFYTGTPQISIPIWDINERGCKLSISLSYNASGVKVEEIPSWVGQGWSLIAGGVITRSVRGLPDDGDNGYGGYDAIGTKIAAYLSNTLTDSAEYEFNKKVAEGIWDTEPDIFYFNFPGKSGKIVFDPQGNPVIIPKQKIRIEGSAALGWDITDDDGTVYSFGEVETTQRLDACDIQVVDPYTSSWYLSRITYVNGNHIEFGYSAGVTYQNLQPTETAYQLVGAQETTGTCGPIPSAGCVVQLKTTTKRLSGIITSGLTSVVFKSPTQRTDLGQYSVDYRLDTIEIHNNSRIVKRFVLGYTNPARLVLDHVQEISNDGLATVNPYKLEYYSPEFLPPVTSKSQDHWGFFNNNGATTLVPAHLWYSPGGFVVPLPGADRSANTNALVGTIRSVSYPTGGTTEFVFEPHDYGYVQLDPLLGPNLKDTTLFLAVTPESTNPSATFDIGVGGMIIRVDYSVNYSPSGTYPDSGEYLDIKDANGQSIMARSIGNATHYLYILNPGTFSVELFSENSQTATSCLVSYKKVKPGVEKIRRSGGIRLKKTIDSDGLNAANDKITTYSYRMNSDTARSSGSVLGEPTYHHPYTLVKAVSIDIGIIELVCEYFARTATANVIGTTQGSHIGYREVTITNEDGARKIVKFTSPTEFADPITFGHPFAIGTSYDYKRGLTIKSESYLADPAGSKLIQQDTSSYHVDDVNRIEVPGLKIAYIVNRPFVQAGDEFSIQPYYHVSEWVYQKQTVSEEFVSDPQVEPIRITKTFAYDNPEHMQLTSSSTESSAGEIIITENSYPLDYATATGVLGEMKGTTHMHSAVVESLTKKIEGGDTLIVSGQYNVYGTLTNSSAVKATLLTNTKSLEISHPVSQSGFQPSVGNSGTPDSRYKSSQTLTYHPQNFNLVQMQKDNDIPIALLWSYGGSLPIAEVKNGTYAQLQTATASASLSLTSIETGFHTDATVRDMVQSIRGFLPSARFTTYTHDPLVGVTSIVDHAGTVTSYQYDGLNRLKLIKDHFGNILSRYDYNYRSY